MLSYQVESFGAPLSEVRRELPIPRGSEVLLEVSCCGVCHSDVHLHDGYFALAEGNRLDLTRSVQPPRTLGHEIAGRVVATGPDAHCVAIGDRRVVYPWIGCGECPVCRRGDEHLCNAPRALGVNRDGGFADHVMAPSPRYLLAFDPLPAEQACIYACSGLTGYSALRKVAPLDAGDSLLVIGAGGVGLSGIRFARHMFDAQPIVAEVDRGKGDVAREAGAASVLDPTEDGALKSLIKSTGGGVAAAVDFVGAASTFAFGLGALRKGGKLVCVGLFGGSAPVVPSMLPLKAISIVGSYVGSLQEMRDMMEIVRSGKLPPFPMTSHPLADATRVLDELKAGRIRGRAILRP